jgi:hypothetical protein
MQIGADTGQVRTQAGRMRAAGNGLLTSAGLGAAAGELGGSGEATPRTSAALTMVSRAWSRGLAETGESLNALADYADAVAGAFDKVGG